MKIAVITDSTSYLSESILKKHNIPIAPLSVTFDNGDNYIENETIFAPEFQERMKKSKTIPTTSQPAIGEFIKKYEQLRDQGYTDIIGVFLSSGISGSYQTATQAAELVEGVNVHTFDSKLAAMVEGSYVLRAIELINKGLQPKDIIDDLTNMRENTGAFLMVDDLKNLQKSGRITGAQAWIGTMLKMKPVLKFDDGKIVPEEKVRTKKKALLALESKVIEQVKELDTFTIFVIGGDKKEDSEWLYNDLKQKYPDYKIIYSEFGPVILAHLGSGGIGLGYVSRDIIEA
ncbi:fatty acid kinase binding subunit FakB1 [Staphylococcus kloosii]|uniref:fatty acid kinase binding subunit FakB1 n=1 Tax=Staphylococcus kloosii TaxID=29384 RepID=UPI0028A573DE|nr:fatty acid kinase binding subunit FakB1 [Staphylococcus kloosii]MDT3958362.1 fatty acid kinase binding subunit FakB1 [Staphylococcus kloosii]